MIFIDGGLVRWENHQNYMDFPATKMMKLEGQSASTKGGRLQGAAEKAKLGST